MNQINAIMSNSVVSIGLLCALIVLLIAFAIAFVLINKRYEKQKINQLQELDTLRSINKNTEAILKKLLNTGNAMHELSEQTDIDALSRMEKLRTILLESFPWSVNVNQNIVLSKIFSGLNRADITSEDISKINLLQHKIEAFRQRLKCYSYPLETHQVQELRSRYLQLSMIAFDVIDSLAEKPNYFEDQQGINVNFLIGFENTHQPHKVTTVEDNQEKWALIMKGILDGIEIDKNTPLVFCGYIF